MGAAAGRSAAARPGHCARAGGMRQERRERTAAGGGRRARGAETMDSQEKGRRKKGAPSPQERRPEEADRPYPTARPLWPWSPRSPAKVCRWSAPGRGAGRFLRRFPFAGRVPGRGPVPRAAAPCRRPAHAQRVAVVRRGPVRAAPAPDRRGPSQRPRHRCRRRAHPRLVTRRSLDRNFTGAARGRRTRPARGRRGSAGRGARLRARAARTSRPPTPPPARGGRGRRRAAARGSRPATRRWCARRRPAPGPRDTRPALRARRRR